MAKNTGAVVHQGINGQPFLKTPFFCGALNNLMLWTRPSGIDVHMRFAEMLATSQNTLNNSQSICFECVL